ncbi:MAG: hypothetical protein ACI35S_06580 [Anaeroplasma sp.]
MRLNKKELVINEEIRNIKIKRIIISFFVSLFLLVFIISHMLIFEIKTKKYEDDIATRRINNSSTI